MVSAGQTATATVTVTESNIAKTMKSGSLEVFATPAMCARVLLWKRPHKRQYNPI